MQEKKCNFCEQVKVISDFSYDRRRGSYGTRCRLCRNAKARAWRKDNPSYEKERYYRDEDRSRWRHIKRKYGLDKAEYEEILLKQKGVCAICGDPPGNRYQHQLHVDHCHATGAVRGLLCRGCNHMLGVVKDDEELLLSAIKYLRSS